MRILISHVNYPSQFRRLLSHWVSYGHDIVFLARNHEWHASDASGFHLLKYSLSRPGGGPYIHPYIRRFENSVLEGQAAAEAIFEFSSSTQWIPDVVISHLGFGNGLFLSDLFPDANRIGLCEWWYQPFNSDVDFLPPHAVSRDHRYQLKVWNSQAALEICDCDSIVVPTFWQASQFPPHLKERLHVVHEGIDTHYLSTLKSGETPTFPFLPDNPDIQILTYVSRCFEEYRGFPQVISAISELQKLRPNLHVLMVGSDGAAYGRPRSDGLGWSEWAKSSIPLDHTRIHWLGSLQESEYHKVLAISDVHLYFTVPFVLSWSLLEAMATGCAIVASSTGPVQEVLVDRQSALLVDFFDTTETVTALHELLSDVQLRSRLAQAAVSRSQDFSTEQGLTGWNALLTSKRDCA